MEAARNKKGTCKLTTKVDCATCKLTTANKRQGPLGPSVFPNASTKLLYPSSRALYVAPKGSKKTAKKKPSNSPFWLEHSWKNPVLFQIGFSCDLLGFLRIDPFDWSRGGFFGVSLGFFLGKSGTAHIAKSTYSRTIVVDSLRQCKCK